MIALDAETGAEAWRVNLAVLRGLDYGDFANRGVVVAGDRVYAGTSDARLACLMRADGRPCDGFGVRGQIALDQGLRRPPKWKGEWTLTSPAVVYRDLVIVGSSIADNSRLDMTSGEVRAFDANTGALRWTFHPLPADSPAGAADTWSRLTVDEANGLVYLPVGSASPDYFGGNRPGDNAHADARRAEGGDRRGRLGVPDRPPRHLGLRRRFAAAPLPRTSRPLGRRRLEDRASVPLRSDYRQAALPHRRAQGAGERRTRGAHRGHAAVPSKPASLVAQTVTEADIWGVTPAEREGCLARFRTLRYDGVFTPPSLKGSLIIPGNIGGLHWGGMAWDPTNRLVIAPVNRLAAIIRLIPSADFPAARKAAGGKEITQQKGTPYAMSREFLLSPEGRPCLSPPWGETRRGTRRHRRDCVAQRPRRSPRAGRPVCRRRASVHRRAQPRRTGGGGRRRAVHRRHHRSVPARVRHRRWPRAVEDAPAHQRARDAAGLHHAERARDGGDRRLVATIRRCRSRGRRCTCSRCRNPERAAAGRC